ncbi:MAG: RNA methyltransferase [Candidatus Nomurabacteria bacterium]|nr:MAG: RNA methyltransferase [Candidatus Nomurabacteria bacterium]
MNVEIKYIKSTDNPLIKEVVKLQLKKRVRDESKLFVIEGFRESSRAFDAGVKIKKLLFSPEWFLKDSNDNLIEQIGNSGAEIIEVAKNTFKKLSYRDRPDGFIALAEQPELSLSKLEVKKDSVFLVVEQIEKPGNLGTLLRGCDAAGIEGMIVCDPVTDVFNPNVVRASTGALFSTPVAVCADSQEALNWLKEKRVRVFSTTPHTENIYWDSNFKTGGPIAIVAGAEQYGLTDLWLKNSDELIKLPMEGSADSLNIAVSSIVCLYEVLRQRNS